MYIVLFLSVEGEFYEGYVFFLMLQWLGRGTVDVELDGESSFSLGLCKVQILESY